MKFTISLILFLVSVSSFGQDSCFVHISIPVACMRENGAHASQLVSQAILGTPMLVVDSTGGEWWNLKGPDGYEGYVNNSSFVPLSDKRFCEWRESPRLIVRSVEEAVIYSDTCAGDAFSRVTSLVNGSVVEEICRTDEGYVLISLPDGRKGYGKSSDFVSLDSIGVLDQDRIIEVCYSLSGTPYLWGGCSTKSMDCSGLVRIAYNACGFLLPRDARDQYGVGIRVADELNRGDLLFFSSIPDGGITHVALYDNDGRYIHCSGIVKTSMMAADDPDYSKRFYRGASRISDTTTGLVSLISHPWYF